MQAIIKLQYEVEFSEAEDGSTVCNCPKFNIGASGNNKKEAREACKNAVIDFLETIVNEY